MHDSAARELSGLLERSRGRDLLLRWAPGSTVDEALERFRTLALAHLRQDPRLVLRATRRVRGLLPAAVGEEGRAALERLHAHALKATGRIRESSAAYEAAWRAYADLGDAVECARTAIGWSDALALAAEPAEGVRVARRALRKLGRREPVLGGRLRGSLATALYQLGRWDDAEGEYAAARRTLLRQGLAGDAAICGANLGNLHLERGDLGRATRWFEKSLAVMQEEQLAVPALHCRFSLAEIAMRRGDWERGLRGMEEVREALREVGDARAVALADGEAAQLYAALGADAMAERHAARSYEALHELGLHHESARAALVHARAMARRGRTRDAMVRLAESIAYWTELGHTTIRKRAELERARMLLLSGRPAEAREELDRLQSWCTREDPRNLGAQCRALRARACLAMDDFAAARRLAARAYDDARDRPARWQRPEIALLLARSLAARGASKEAVRWARRSVREFEATTRRLGRGRLRQALSTPLEELVQGAVDIVLEHGGKDAARQAVDLLSVARSPALIEDLLRGRRPPLAEELRSAIAKLRDSLLSSGEGGASDVRSRALRGQVARLERKLEEVSTQLPPLARDVVRKRSVGHWARALRDRELVLYDRSREGWRAFVVDARGTVRCVKLTEGETALRSAWLPLRMMFEAAAHAPAEARGAFLERTLDEANRSLLEIQRAFWAPLELRAGEVVLAPSGPLNGVPLEASVLLAEQECGATPTHLSRVPHPALLGNHERPRSDRALLLEGLVPGATEEIEAVRGQLEAAGFATHTERTRAGFLSHDDAVGVLHVAAHGSYHRSRMLSTGIQLEDGWLGFEQLDPRRLAGALLFFDSCESGLAMEAPGTELDGWMSAGLAAGARDFVLTLWKLDDEAARAFATGFYAEWCADPHAPRAATRARLRARENRTHPFAWGPFVTVG